MIQATGLLNPLAWTSPPVPAFVQLGFSMKLTHFSPVQYWFIQRYWQVYIHNWYDNHSHRHSLPFHLFVPLGFSMKLTHLSPVRYWFIQSYWQVYIHNWFGIHLHWHPLPLHLSCNWVFQWSWHILVQFNTDLFRVTDRFIYTIGMTITYIDIPFHFIFLCHWVFQWSWHTWVQFNTVILRIPNGFIYAIGLMGSRLN